MAYEFVRRADDMVMCRLDPQEMAIIAQVAQEVSDLIRADLGMGEEPEAVREAAGSDDPLARLEAEFAVDSPREPRDSAVRRLFPAASEEDPALAEEFRRLGQGDLASAKLSALGVVQRSIDRVGPTAAEIVLDEEAATAWLTGLNDMRLVLADRLSLRDDEDLDTLRMLQQIAEDAGIDGEDLERAAGGTPEGADASGEGDGPTAAGPDLVLAVYDLLTWLQESLVRVVAR